MRALPAPDAVEHARMLRPVLERYATEEFPWSWFVNGLKDCKLTMFIADENRTMLVVSPEPGGDLVIEIVHSSMPGSIRRHIDEVLDIAHGCGCRQIVCRAHSISRERLYRRFGFKADAGRMVKIVRSGR